CPPRHRTLPRSEHWSISGGSTGSPSPCPPRRGPTRQLSLQAPPFAAPSPQPGDFTTAPTPRNRIRNPFCGKDVLKLLRCHSLAVQPAAVRGMSAVTSTENRSMKGKTIVATGATSGIGEAAVLELAGMGARVVAIARHQRRAQA